jgi:pimeloyl-ACP methyl ester carboxylesterase
VTTFALVHGAWHGAWCFERLVAELQRRDHEAFAIDLPATDVTAGNVAYAGVIEAALPAGDDVVLVGHSLAGLSVPLVAARRPLRLLVYLCALIPEPGRSLVDRLRTGEPIFVEGFSDTVVRDDEGRSYWPDREAAIHDLYDDCPRGDAEAAFARLRPQARLPSIEACPLDTLPAGPAAYLLAAGDHSIHPAWSRSAARERLGVQAIELPGGHSPFLSRPRELADLLLGII